MSSWAEAASQTQTLSWISTTLGEPILYAVQNTPFGAKAGLLQAMYRKLGLQPPAVFAAEAMQRNLDGLSPGSWGQENFERQTGRSTRLLLSTLATALTNGGEYTVASPTAARSCHCRNQMWEFCSDLGLVCHVNYNKILITQPGRHLCRIKFKTEGKTAGDGCMKMLTSTELVAQAPRFYSKETSNGK